MQDNVQSLASTQLVPQVRNNWTIIALYINPNSAVIGTSFPGNAKSTSTTECHSFDHCTTRSLTLSPIPPYCTLRPLMQCLKLILVTPCQCHNNVIGGKETNKQSGAAAFDNGNWTDALDQ